MTRANFKVAAPQEDPCDKPPPFLPLISRPVSRKSRSYKVHEMKIVIENWWVVAHQDLFVSFGRTAQTRVYDKQNTECIKQFFNGKHGIQEVDEVFIVVNGTLFRLTSSKDYIFQSVLSIFGHDIRDNINLFVTFDDGHTVIRPWASSCQWPLN